MRDRAAPPWPGPFYEGTACIGNWAASHRPKTALVRIEKRTSWSMMHGREESDPVAVAERSAYKNRKIDGGVDGAKGAG